MTVRSKQCNAYHKPQVRKDVHGDKISQNISFKE